MDDDVRLVLAMVMVTMMMITKIMDVRGAAAEGTEEHGGVRMITLYASRNPASPFRSPAHES